MEIKQANSSNAAEALLDLLREVSDRFRRCQSANHDFFTAIYMSSLIISRATSYNGQNFLDMISNMGTTSPQNFLWIVRTASPYNFPGSMMRLQNQSVNFLRPRSYLVVYDKRTTFLNHAKFALSYHVCFSESVAYHGRYFGSTNLTTVGLAHPPRGAGNFEEYQSSYRIRQSLGSGDLGYLEEMHGLVTFCRELRTSAGPLHDFVNEHLSYLQGAIAHAKATLKGTTLAELYSQHIELAFAHNRTISFLDQLPGRKLAHQILDRALGGQAPPNPFEVELEAGSEGSMEEEKNNFGFEEGYLRNQLEGRIRTLEQVSSDLRKDYLPNMANIARFEDDTESEFTESATKYEEKRIGYLSRVIDLADGGVWPKSN